MKLTDHIAPGYFTLVIVVMLLNGCATSANTIDIPPDAEKQRISDLGTAIRALDNAIDPGEAQHAARIAIEYSRQLAVEYDITGSPLFHNMLVNLGVRSKGLCTDWTADLRTRLRQEKFRSLELHWAVANYRTAFGIEHSTVVISSPGSSIYQGMVLDPWRNSGDLYWSPTLEDSRYSWEPRAEIMALKRGFEADADNRAFVR